MQQGIRAWLEVLCYAYSSYAPERIRAMHQNTTKGQLSVRTPRMGRDAPSWLVETHVMKRFFRLA